MIQIVIQLRRETNLISLMPQTKPNCYKNNESNAESSCFSDEPRYKWSKNHWKVQFTSSERVKTKEKTMTYFSKTRSPRKIGVISASSAYIDVLSLATIHAAVEDEMV